MSNFVTQVGEPVTARTPGGEATQILWKSEDGYILTSAANTEWVSETMAFVSNKDRDIVVFVELGVADFGDHEGALESAGYTIEWTEGLSR